MGTKSSKLKSLLPFHFNRPSKFPNAPENRVLKTQIEHLLQELETKSIPPVTTDLNNPSASNLNILSAQNIRADLIKNQRYEITCNSINLEIKTIYKNTSELISNFEKTNPGDPPENLLESIRRMVRQLNGLEVRFDNWKRDLDALQEKVLEDYPDQDLDLRREFDPTFKAVINQRGMAIIYLFDMVCTHGGIFDEEQLGRFRLPPRSQVRKKKSWWRFK